MNYKKINGLYPFNYLWNVGKAKYFFRDESILFIVTMIFLEAYPDRRYLHGNQAYICIQIRQ